MHRDLERGLHVKEDPHNFRTPKQVLRQEGLSVCQGGRYEHNSVCASRWCWRCVCGLYAPVHPPFALDAVDKQRTRRRWWSSEIPSFGVLPRATAEAAALWTQSWVSNRWISKRMATRRMVPRRWLWTRAILATGRIRRTSLRKVKETTFLLWQQWKKPDRMKREWTKCEWTKADARRQATQSAWARLLNQSTQNLRRAILQLVEL